MRPTWSERKKGDALVERPPAMGASHLLAEKAFSKPGPVRRETARAGLQAVVIS